LPAVKWRVTLTALVAVTLGGCLGGSDRTAEVQRGKQLFAKAGCGNCHTLGETGAKGKIGPSLDAIRPDFAKVLKQVTAGGRGMPAFGDRLSNEEIAAIARYVSDAAGKSLGAVTTQFEPDDTRLSECRGTEDQVCYQQAFGNRVYRTGPAPALALLERRMATDRPVSVGCHRIAHTMGAAALVRLKNDVGQAFAEGTAVCSSGYYHGILERAFVGVEDDELAEKARSLCKGGPVEEDPFLAFQCMHGLGHGLMLHTDYDLPLALDTCDRIGDAGDAQVCHDGVFMENFTSFYQVSSKWLRDDDLIYPCNVVSERRKHSCYIIVTARILPKVKYDWRKAAQICRTSEPRWEYVCFRSFGRDAISTNAYDQEVARRLCHLTDDREGECVLSVALHIANEERGLRGAGRFCRETPARLRVDCYAGLGSTAQIVLPNARRRARACRGLTERGEELLACITGQRT
jgi:cytochrome c553